jgi:hypothetical protein
MKTKLQNGEKILKDGRANLQSSVDTVGGKLFLTDQRLIFESHKFNVQTGATEISLSNVMGVKPCWTKFLGIIPLAPNSMAVMTKDGKSRQFVVSRRDSWIEEICSEI